MAMIGIFPRTVPLIALLALAGMLLGSPGPSSAASTGIAVGDLWFCSSSFQDGVCTTTISAGDTVSWDFGGATTMHTTTSDSSVWNSGNVAAGGSFQFTFSQAGAFPYHCTIHPQQMKGVIVVQAAPTPTAPLAGQTPPAGVTPSATRGAPLPVAGQGPASSSTSWWWLAALAAGGVALIAFGALASYKRARA